VLGLSQVEFVLILIVPSSIHHAYVSFTQLVRSNYLDWLFKAGTNEFDKTLERMPGTDCFRPWHEENDRLPAPTVTEENDLLPAPTVTQENDQIPDPTVT
jgi:hypothetical protein